MTANTYDAIVVGARCAGAPTAMLLAQQGHRVLLVDRSTFPSDTLSTHFIQPYGMAVLDRSWYGRVLVERVEGFASEADWMRAYGEINDFEGALIRHGTVVVKFWLAITKEEQFKRFKVREKTSFKRFKITEEDWRNRKKWDAYELAVCDMIDRTSTALAPWTLIEANNKYHARLKVLKTLTRALEDALERMPKPKGKKK